MKKVIFFDGDGTLWYPKTTKRTKAPHWVYLGGAIDPYEQFVITPTTAETLEELGKRQMKRVLLSTSPLPEDEAIINRIKITQLVDIHHLLDDIQVSPDYPAGKGEQILKLLEKYELKPEDALMVGDSFKWDYKSAQDVGVDGLLLESEYQQEFIRGLQPNQIITELIDLLKHLK